MSDIYVFSPSDDDNDYDSMGLVGALVPTECTFEETANGESIVTMSHPLDEYGRYAALQRGNILVVPVPVRTTPEIQNGSCVSVMWKYKIKSTITTKAERTLYKKASGKKKKKLMKIGDELTVVYKPNGEGRWKAKTKYGTGWVNADENETALELITTYTGLENNANVIQEIQSPWTVTDQYFRIYETKRGIDSIEVSARHISYDLLYNITSFDKGDETSLQAALDGVLNNCYSSHEFTAKTNISNVQVGLYYNGKNPIECFLDPEEGICAKYKVDLIRDNYELFFLDDPGLNRGVRIQYGKNMTGIEFTESDDEVVTRIIPVGEKKNGDPLYLSDTPSQRYIDITDYAEDHPDIAETIPSYPFSHVLYLECENCKVEGKVSVDTIKNRMREQANKMFDDGCYNPKIQMSVEFVNLGDTEEYQQFKNLENSFLFDYIIVQHPRLMVDVTAQIVKIKWNCLADRMEGVGIGSVGETIANMGITTWQIPAGFSGSKIATGSIGSKNLGKEIINAEHIQANTINVKQLNANEITAYMISAVKGNFASLSAGQITTDELYATFAQLAKAELNEAIIEYADINSLVAKVAEIASAQIEEADITTAKINHADIETLAAGLALIVEAEIEHAEIDEALIDWAAIKSLTAQMASLAVANVGDVTIGKASIDWADIERMGVQFADIDHADIGDVHVREALIEQLTAEVTETMTLKAKDADFDFATAQRFVSSAMILDRGVGGTVTIENLTATNAMLVQATLGKLTVKGDDDHYYDVSVAADGTIYTEDTGYTDADIIDGRAPNGRPVVATTAAIAELNSTNIQAQSMIVGEIFTAGLQANVISATEAFLASATIPEIYTTSIQAIGNTLDLSANQSIRLVVGEMQVGGRNLVLDSAIGKVVTVTNQAQTPLIGYISGHGKADLYPVGTKFTISYEAKASSAGQQINGRYLRGATNSDFVYEGGDLHTLTTEWQRFSYSGVITASGAQRVVVYIYPGTSGDKVYLRHFQLETGDKSTDWKTAPEDPVVEGRNLTTGTGVSVTVAPEGSNNWCSPPFYENSDFGMELLSDETIESYSIGFDYSYSGADTAVDGYVLLRNSDNSHASAGSSAPMTINVGSGSGHCTLSFTPTSAQRQYGTTWMLSGMGTGNRDIKITVTNFKFEIGSFSTNWTAAPEDAQDTADDALSSAQTLQGDVDMLRQQADEAMNMLQSLSVGGANLIEDSELIRITGTDSASTSYRMLATDLLPGTVYTFSMESATRISGSAAGMTFEVVRLPSTVVLTQTLNFSGGHQKYTFTTGVGDATYEARLYAGIKGSGNGRVVEISKAKLETGTFATMWTPAHADIEAKLLALTSEFNVTQSGLENIVSHITEDVDGTISNVNSFMKFDATNASNPKLIIGTTSSPMMMELSNSQLSFLWRGNPVAYFSDNKLYVTNVEGKERISVGTDNNGYLDIVTTRTGVGFLWRSEE